jgi:hypothetical protein
MLVEGLRIKVYGDKLVTTPVRLRDMLVVHHGQRERSITFRTAEGRTSFRAARAQDAGMVGEMKVV